MKLVVVDIAAHRVTSDPSATIITYALGSCIGVVVWDPIRHAGGLLHYMLANASLAPERAREKPAMFGDTGIPLLLTSLVRPGCERRHLVVKIAGGGNIQDERNIFQIGKKNIEIATTLLAKAGLTIASRDVGGGGSRTVALEVGTGRTTIRSAGRIREL